MKELEVLPELTAFLAMKLAIMNCGYLHKLEDIIDLYQASDFSREEQGLLICLFLKQIDKLARVKDYKYICSLKLKCM